MSHRALMVPSKAHWLFRWNCPARFLHSRTTFSDIFWFPFHRKNLSLLSFACNLPEWLFFPKGSPVHWFMWGSAGIWGVQYRTWLLSCCVINFYIIIPNKIHANKLNLPGFFSKDVCFDWVNITWGLNESLWAIISIEDISVMLLIFFPSNFEQCPWNKKVAHLYRFLILVNLNILEESTQLKIPWS